MDVLAPGGVIKWTSDLDENRGGLRLVGPPVVMVIMCNSHSDLIEVLTWRINTNNNLIHYNECDIYI